MHLDILRAEVKRNTEKTQSLITLVRGLAAKLEEFKDEPAEIQALADELKANTDAIAAEVDANTET